MSVYPVYIAEDGGELVISEVREHTIEGTCFHEDIKKYHPLGTTSKTDLLALQKIGEIDRKQYVNRMADYDGLTGNERENFTKTLLGRER